MAGACGLLTLILKAKDRASIVRFCESLRHILMAVSWGGHESLVIPRCAGIADADFLTRQPRTPLRQDVCGAGGSEYLIADLDQASLPCSTAPLPFVKNHRVRYLIRLLLAHENPDIQAPDSQFAAGRRRAYRPWHSQAMPGSATLRRLRAEE